MKLIRRYRSDDRTSADEVERQTIHDTEVSMVSSLIDSEGHTPSTSSNRRGLMVAAASLMLAATAAFLKRRRKRS